MYCKGTSNAYTTATGWFDLPNTLDQVTMEAWLSICLCVKFGTGEYLVRNMQFKFLHPVVKGM